jgi:hypothetical protein
MIAVAIISGANLILVKGPRANVDFGHAARRHVRACRLIGTIRKSVERFSEKIMPNNEARTATRLRRFLQRAQGG